MSKYISYIFVVAFILLGFNLNFNSVNAYDSGCYGSNTYSVTTGQPCYANTYQYTTNIPGCTGAGPYSTLTGQLCSSTVYPTPTPVYIPGCNGAGPYSVLTGAPCYGSTGGGGTYINQQFYIGQSGPEVVALQQMLFNAGFYFAGIDGFYGPITDRAFAAYKNQYVNPIPAPVDPCTYATAGYYPNNCAVYGSKPVISGVGGPQTLSVNQSGTWTVNAYDNNQYNQSGNVLSYSVNWGDDIYRPLYFSNSSNIYQPQQSATFSHSYSQAGTYTAIFTVTNSAGLTAQTSLTVNVTGSAYYGSTPVISYISPDSGFAGNQVTIYGTGFTNSVYNCPPYANCAATGNSNNTINFGGNVIPNVYSNNGTSLIFIVPSYTNPPCFYSYPACAMPSREITPGIYPVFVTNANGSTSNAVNFTVLNRPYAIY